VLSPDLDSFCIVLSIDWPSPSDLLDDLQAVTSDTEEKVCPMRIREDVAISSFEMIHIFVWSSATPSVFVAGLHLNLLAPGANVPNAEK
jgi:hypothetical protein